MGLRKLLGLKRPAEKQNIRFKRSYTNSVAGTRAFLHIGKTGGSGVGDLIRKLRAQGYDTPGRLDHQTTCDWLNLDYRKPDVDKRMNAGRGEDLTEQQLQRLRERLDPLYRDLEARGFRAEAPGWWWS